MPPQLRESLSSYSLHTIGSFILILVAIIAYYQKEMNDDARETNRMVVHLMLSDTVHTLAIRQQEYESKFLQQAINAHESRLNDHDLFMTKHGWQKPFHAAKQ